MIGALFASLLSRVGPSLFLVGGGAALLAAVYGAGDLRGRHAAGASCQAAAIQSQLDATRMDLAEAKKSRADAEQKAAAVQANAAQLQQKVGDYEKELVKRKVGRRCALGARDVKRLRNILPAH